MHIQGQSRDQGTLFPERLDDLIDGDNVLRVWFDRDKLEVLADAGYSSGKLFKYCQTHGLRPYVPVQRAINNQGGRYVDKIAFSYRADGGCFEWPAGERLVKKNRSIRNRLYLYTSEACAQCRLRSQCTATWRHG